MKKAMLLLLAAVTLLGFVACPNPTGGDDPIVQYSEWWIKGSFDNWGTAPKHFFAIEDELAPNILTFVIDNLYPIDYEFVLVNPTGGEIKYSTDDNIAPDTEVTMGGGSNASFTASKKSYTIRVDITNPAAPKLKIVSGAEPALAITEAVMASFLKIKGDQFSIGWTATAGTFDATAKTVTFPVTVVEQLNTFGFESVNGFLKGVRIDSPAAVGDSTVPVPLGTTGSNIWLAGVPKDNATYDVVVTLDASGATVGDMYTVSVKLTNEGDIAWPPLTPPTDLYFVGALDGVAGMTDWSELDAGRAHVAVASDQAVLTYTATATEKQVFKWATAANAGWNGLVGYGYFVETSGSDGTGGTALVSGDGENLAFDAVAGNQYSIIVDYSVYAETGIAILLVMETTP